MSGGSGRRVERGLDGVNFFLADVGAGLGPYLAVYLLTVAHWDAERIGIVMTVTGLAGLAAQMPMGALIDAAHRKRALVIVALVVVPAASFVVVAAPRFWPVAAANAVAGAVAAAFGPAIAAMTLGATPAARFTARIGRNEGFNHLGNAAGGVLVAIGGYAMGPIAALYLVAAFAVGSVAATLVIPPAAIDHERARGAAVQDGAPVPLAKLFRDCPPLVVFGVSIALFHLANAAMLPLVGQKLALGDQAIATTLMAACIIGAQMVMVPMALLVGARADRWGRKPILLAGFAMLPIRGVLYTLSDDPLWLLGVQLLDGVGAGIFGATFPLVIADLTRGSGRYNVAQGALATAQGVGAALSTTLAGAIVVRAGYGVAFLVLASIAALAFLTLAAAMPETRITPARISEKGGGRSNG